MPIPDFLIERDEQTILEEMLDALPAELDRSEGGFPWDTQVPSSIQYALLSERARLILEWCFAQTTFGEFLDLRAGEHGVVRKPAVSAKGTLHFVGTPGADIPAGTVWSTQSTESVPAQMFTTDIDAVVDGGGTVDVAVTAVAPGAAGNVGADTVTLPQAAVPGVETGTNPGAMGGGADIESDAQLLARYLQRVRNPGSSGNIADYINWALEVANVGAVAVVPLEDGPGTVTVAIADANKLPADVATVDAVQAYIAPGGLNTGTGKAPIGAAVTVEAATQVDIDVQAELVVAAGYDIPTVQAAAVASIDAYLKSIAFVPDNDVRHAKVVTSIIDTPGVVDALNVEIRKAADPFDIANIAIATKEIAVLDDVTWL